MPKTGRTGPKESIGAFLPVNFKVFVGQECQTYLFETTLLSGVCTAKILIIDELGYDEKMTNFKIRMPNQLQNPNIKECKLLNNQRRRKSINRCKEAEIEYTLK